MENLSEQMQARLDKWRKSLIPVTASQEHREPVKVKMVHVKSGKNDYGDVMSLEEWDDEIRRSQTYRR